ncbi:MAG: hypothetical protein E7288_08540 [Lachnospiraceae bacterium]|nr:hypothetical protein [Lachnospiraceae bacterium]
MSKWVKRIKERYQSDATYRMEVSLYANFGLNVAYAILQFCLGYFHHTVWFYSFAGYHLLLALIRFRLAHYTRRQEICVNLLKEWKLYRFCGGTLFLLHILLAFFIYYIVWQGRAFVHHEITVITLATYTFYAFTMAVISFNKYRKYKSPVYTAGKMLGLATAFVSMLTLEKAMLATFSSGDDEKFRLIMTGSTGAGVTILILGMAIYMVVVANKQIKKIKQNEK